MTIISYALSEEKIPLKTPFITALRRVEHVEFLRVSLHTEEGYIGIGEAPPTKAITGEDMASIRHAIESWIMPSILNREFDDIESIEASLHNSCPDNHSAKAAIDIAIYDLFAQKRGLPPATYLDVPCTSVCTDITISLNPPDVMAEDALKAFNQGYTLLKVKVGGKDGLDIERIKSVRQAVQDAILLIDANQAWSRQEASDIIDAVKPCKPALIEQPVIAGDIESMRRLTDISDIPILADESVFSYDDAVDIINRHAAHMINIKLMKCGGIHQAIRIIELCKEKGLKCMMGSMLEGPYSITAAMQLSLQFPETVIYHDLDSPLLYAGLPENSPVTFNKNRLFKPSTCANG